MNYLVTKVYILIHFIIATPLGLDRSIKEAQGRGFAGSEGLYPGMESHC